MDNEEKVDLKPGIVWAELPWSVHRYSALVGKRTYWPGDDSPKAKTLTETLFSQEQYDGDWPPEGAAAFIAWFQAKLAKIPKSLRASARIELDSESGYEGSHYASIKITYKRKETKGEIAERRAGYAEQKKRAEADERAEFEALKAKFEPR